MICRNCSQAIQRPRYFWFHTDTGLIACQPPGRSEDGRLLRADPEAECRVCGYRLGTGDELTLWWAHAKANHPELIPEPTRGRGSMSEEAPHDELITVRMPVWAWQGIVRGIESWASDNYDHWDETEIMQPVEFVDVPPSWHIETADGKRYLLRAK